MLQRSRWGWKGGHQGWVKGCRSSLELRRGKSSANSVNKIDCSEDERMQLKYERRVDIDINRFKTRKLLTEMYHRYVRAIDNQQVLQAFKKPSEPGYYHQIQTIQQLRDQGFHYYNGNEPTVRTIIDGLINTVLVELNLRKLFVGDINDSKLLIKDVAGVLMKNEELMVQLAQFYNGSQLPEQLRQLFDNLNKPLLVRLMEDLGQIPSFSSLNTLRMVFSYNKSNDYLNYETSEVSRFTKGLATGYTKRYEDDESLILELRQMFDSIPENLDQLSKLDLILRITSQLINSKSPPGLNYFTELLDHLNRLDLMTFQTLILTAIVDPKFKVSLLSTDDPLIDNSELVVYYFKPIIEKNPNFLNILFDYYDKRENESMIELLLSYLKFDEVINLEQLFRRSIYNQLLSKSRFIKNRNLDRLVAIEYTNPVLINYRTLINVINKCVKFRKTEYIDLLINKLIFHSTSNGQVILSINESLDLTQFKFVIDNEKEDVNEILIQLFDRDLMILLLKLAIDSNDLGRLMWLIPNLDIFIERHLDHEKLLNLRKLYNENSDDFESLNNELQVNLNLIFYIFRCVKDFGLEGKLLHYEKKFGIKADEFLGYSTGFL